MDQTQAAVKVESSEQKDGPLSPLRTILMLGFWIVTLPIAGLIGIPWSYLVGNVNFLYKACMWGAWTGAQLTGVRVEIIGLDKLDHSRRYIYMSNHISNLDPPITVPLIPERCSVLVKKELFKVPIFGHIMRMGSLVPVDRGNRDAGIAAVRDSIAALRGHNLSMVIYVEGHRSFDGKLLPFKKGPFYLAEECQMPVVPITVSGTEHVMPKAHFGIRPGAAKVQFHPPIEPKDFGTRDELMAKVRAVINSGLPKELQE